MLHAHVSDKSHERDKWSQRACIVMRMLSGGVNDADELDCRLVHLSSTASRSLPLLMMHLDAVCPVDDVDGSHPGMNSTPAAQV